MRNLGIEVCSQRSKPAGAAITTELLTGSTKYMGQAAAPSLLRLCVAEDGRAKANFSDNSLLLLSAQGSLFTHCPPGEGASTTTQLSEFALTRHVPQLDVVLEFRNMHVDQPFFCKPLLRSGAPRQGLALGYLIRELWWPATADEAVSKGLVEPLPDGRLVLSTADSSARMVLHAHRRRFAVCYPLLVGERPYDGKYEYVWHTQVFSLRGYPPRWQPAVELLMDVVRTLDAQQQQQQQLEQGPGSTAAATAEPPQGAYPAPATELYPPAAGQQLVLHPAAAHTPSQRCVVLPTATDRGLGGGREGFKQGSWWFEPTLTLLPSDEIITLEWTPEGLYQYNPSSQEAEVWVHHDESCLATVKQGRFIARTRHDATAGTAVEQLYAASCVPETTWLGDGGGQGQPPVRISLAQLAAHAQKLR